MAISFLHGVEVLDIDTGPRPIRTVKSSVIGLVGTAPDAAPAVAASTVTGSEGAGNALQFTARSPGANGNSIRVALIDPGTASSSLTLTESGNRLDISLATGSDSAIISTAAEVLALVNGSESGSSLVSVVNAGSSGGAGIARPTSQFLGSGADDPFPINQPTLINGSRQQAAGLGSSGTLPQATEAIFNQTGASIVVIRVAEGADAAATLTNIIGGVDGNGQYTGMQALLGAESVVHVAPKILIAPGFSSEAAVATSFQTLCDRLRAIAIIEGPDTTDTDAIAYRNQFGHKRLYLADPGVLSWDAATNRNQMRSNSAYIAGLMARVDNELGFWWSPSNQPLYGISGLVRPVDFMLGDRSSRANYLNENEITTVIRQDGYRLWGNRTCSNDPKWAFINVVRTADILNDSLQREHLWAVDRCINKTYLADVQAGVNAYLRSLIAQGAILGGSCWPDPDLNTPENMAAGKVYWNFDFTPPAPAEHLTFQSIMTDDYYSTLQEVA